MSNLFPDRLEFYQALYQSSSEGIILSDERGELIFINEAAQKFLGNSIKNKPDAAWESLYHFFHADQTTPMQKEEMPIFRALQGEVLKNVEVFISKVTGDKSVLFLCNARPIFDVDGKTIGAISVFQDITQKRFINKFANLSQALTQSESRFRAIFEQSPLSIQLLSKDGKTIHVNPAYKKLWGFTDEIINNYILKEYNMLQDKFLEESGVLPLVKKGFEGETVHIHEFRYDPKKIGLDGQPRWTTGIIYPLKGSSGNVKEVALIHQDMTERRRDEASHAFLANIKSILLSNMNYGEILNQLAMASIPFLADGFIVDLVENDTIQRLVTKHTDPQIELLMRELQERFPPRMDSPQPTPRVIRSGEPELMCDVDINQIRAHSCNEEHAKLMRKIGVHSHIAVPLEIRGKIIGALNLFITTDRAKYDEKDLDTAMGLARNAAVAIDNSRLFRDAQNAIKIRDEFISIASHELRTPVTSLNLQIEVLNDIVSSFTEETTEIKLMKKFLAGTNGQLQRLTRLIEDMLDISRISSGKLSLNLKSVDFVELTRRTLDQFDDQLKSLRIPLKFHAPEKMLVSCDPEKLEQVITNFMTNAIRYGGKRPIAVSLEETNKIHILKVQDHGRGIHENDINRIFNQFERAHTEEDVSGLGLGLFINKKIIDEHQGRILVESEVGKGSTFIVELPKY